MSRTRRPSAALALLAVVALISGCGASSPANTGGTDNSAGNAQKAVKFAKCMRTHGVSQFPDPSASGKLTIDAVANGSSLNTNSAEFTHALSACKQLEPAGFMGTKRTPAQQSAALKFAQCMRENGVKDFPDPGLDQPLVDTRRIPSATQPGGMSMIHAAMQKCRDTAAAAGVQR